MMMTILYLWAVVAVTHTTGGYVVETVREWRPMGEFRSQVDCERAAAQLVLPAKHHRCVSTGKPS